MLDKVEVITDQGVMLTLPLRDSSQGYSVQDIEGLDPVNATIVSSPFGAMDGEQYQSSRREKRNIVLTLGYEPDYVTTFVEGLRKKLYSFFMPKSRILLRFYQEGQAMVQIYGRVESLTSPKFSAEPTAVISVLNFEPDFYDPVGTVITGNTTAGTTETTHLYEGTVETGILFKLLVNRNVNEFTIFHRPPDDSLRSLEFGSALPLLNGDVLSISTVPGNKFVTLTRGGIGTSQLYSVSPQSNWISLFPGNNKLRVQAEGAAIPYRIEYTTKLGGL